MSTECCEVTAA